MFKLIKISFVMMTVISLFSCGDPNSGRSKDRYRRFPEVKLPAKDAKVAFIFPAGAGAMRVILGVTEQMEKDLGITTIGSVIDVAGGVSSGSLVAAALTQGDPAKINSGDLKNKVGSLVRAVFPYVNRLIDKMIADYKFTLGELNEIYREMTSAKNLADLSSVANAETTLERVLTEAGKKQPSILIKINAKGDTARLKKDLAPEIAAVTGSALTRSNVLRGIIIDPTLLGNNTLDDPLNKKFYAIASNNKQPMFFGPPSFAPFVSGAFADGTTDLYKALIASSAIPGFIQGPTDVSFAGRGVVPDLKDGFLAVTFDPSAVLYDIYEKQFSNDNIFIVFVGNGAAIDSAFRDKIGEHSGLAEKTRANGKKTTFAAIDSHITNGKESLFDLSGFYDHTDLANYMDEAAKKACETKAYAWTIKALKSVMGK